MNDKSKLFIIRQNAYFLIRFICILIFVYLDFIVVLIDDIKKFLYI